DCAFSALLLCAADQLGCLPRRRYGVNSFQPSGNCFFASSSDSAGKMTTSSPTSQFTGVDTLCLSDSWMASMTRRISGKLRPALFGYVSVMRIFLSGSIRNTQRTEEESPSPGWIMSYRFDTVRSPSPMIGKLTGEFQALSMSLDHSL